MAAVISLLRFKCVCKAWYALITRQNFVHKHLLHNKNRNPLFLVHRRDRTTRDYLVSRLSYETLQIIKLLKFWESDPNLIYFEKDKKFQSELYSLSSNSWRKVDSLPHVYSRGFMGAYTNGIASWWAQNDCEIVLSFDMSNEVFLTTPLPDEGVIGQVSDTWKNFFVLNELVAMAIYIIEEGPFGLDIWFLLEYGVKESWTKMITVGPLTGFIQTLGYGKNDTICLDKSEGELVLFDPSTKEMRSLQIGHPASLSLQLTPMKRP
ncbi:hypothetical protein CJ030_MR0G004585 [Morella rubra]|uniref:Uncharacterized protein n=1 Tax=Morella rubra TaxID=262757 RepID=A0A6A1UN77_9ROSI|nr:hypothetical protein CJ030_MR0G004585 [Morella rubra]